MCQTGCCCFCYCFCSVPHWAVMPRMLWQHTMLQRREPRQRLWVLFVGMLPRVFALALALALTRWHRQGAPMAICEARQVASVENKRKKLLTRFETRFLNGCLMPSQVCLTDWLTWRSACLAVVACCCYYAFPAALNVAQSQSQSQSARHATFLGCCWNSCSWLPY